MPDLDARSGLALHALDVAATLADHVRDSFLGEEDLDEVLVDAFLAKLLVDALGDELLHVGAVGKCAVNIHAALGGARLWVFYADAHIAFLLELGYGRAALADQVAHDRELAVDNEDEGGGLGVGEVAVEALEQVEAAVGGRGGCWPAASVRLLGLDNFEAAAEEVLGLGEVAVLALHEKVDQGAAVLRQGAVCALQATHESAWEAAGRRAAHLAQLLSGGHRRLFAAGSAGQRGLLAGLLGLLQR
mmetsp:Transcript_23838/g.67659  ORF Transcript_23838/g.67659 Transcript_23838/m.67659 type:complete len:246 (-) Transcript_23838:127-864(-)